MFSLTHMDKRARRQIYFLCPYHSVVLCLQRVEVCDSLGQYCQRDRIFFFLALRKTSMKNTEIVILVKQIFVNKVMKGLI